MVLGSLRAGGPAAAAGIPRKLGEDDLGHGAAAQAGERAAHLPGREPVPGAPGPETFTRGPQEGRPGFCVFAVISHSDQVLLIADGNTVATNLYSVQDEKRRSLQIFADRLKALRRRAGWSQKVLAEKMSVNPGVVASWEVGRAFPRPDRMVRLAELLQVPYDEIVSGASNEVQEKAGQETAAPRGDLYLAMSEEARLYLEEIIKRNEGNPARLGWVIHEMRRMFDSPALSPTFTTVDAGGGLSGTEILALETLRQMLNEKLRKRGLPEVPASVIHEQLPTDPPKATAARGAPSEPAQQKN